MYGINMLDLTAGKVILYYIVQNDTEIYRYNACNIKKTANKC